MTTKYITTTTTATENMAELSANRKLIYDLLECYHFHDDPENVELTFVSNFIAELPEKLLADFVHMFDKDFLAVVMADDDDVTGDDDSRQRQTRQMTKSLDSEQIEHGQRLIVANGLKMGENIFDRKLYKQYFMYTYAYGAADEATNEACCIICFEAFAAGAMLIRLPCVHSFHESCIRTWFQNNFQCQRRLTCPMCRKSLIDPEQEGHVATTTWTSLDIGAHLRSLC